MPRAISQRYRKLALKLKLRSTRLHSLRHYSATELVAAGVDIRTVAGRLGHGSGGATTLKVYAGWVNEADRRAADTMATIVPKPVPAPAAPRGPYEVIAEALREQIRTGQLKPGDRNQSGVAIQSIAFSQVSASADGSTLQWAPGRRRSAAPLTGYRRSAADDRRTSRHEHRRRRHSPPRPYAAPQRGPR